MVALAAFLADFMIGIFDSLVSLIETLRCILTDGGKVVKGSNLNHPHFLAKISERLFQAFGNLGIKALKKSSADFLLVLVERS